METMTPGSSGVQTQIGPYLLTREAGRGATSTVYEGVDARLGRKVAVKLIAIPSFLSPERREQMIARIRRETRAIGRLSHPNIVTIYDVGEQDGTHYLVMEFLDGQTLRARLDGGPPLSLEEAAGILDQVAEGLSAVHAEGVVHRDIKPSNVMLLPGGPGVRVKLMDFGVARQADDTTVTHTGTTVGSPAYMAPEQVRGESGTPSSDIWALGALLYEMIAGHPPFAGQSVPSVLYQVAHENPSPVPGVSPAIGRVLSRALEKEPARRFSSARDLADAFRTAAFSPGGQTPRAAIPPPAARRSSRPSPVAIAGLFLLAAGALGGSYLVRAGSPERSASSVAPNPKPAPTFPTPHPALNGGAPERRVARLRGREDRDGEENEAKTVSVANSRKERDNEERTASRSESLPSEPDSSRPRRRATRLSGAPPFRAGNSGREEARETERAQRQVTRRDASEDARPAETGAKRLLGTWHGTHTGQPATLTITEQSGNAFSGTMTVRTASGPVRLGVSGVASPRSGAIRLRETHVIGGGPNTWDLGSNSGRMLGDGQMSGVGSDARHRRPYAWSFSR